MGQQEAQAASSRYPSKHRKRCRATALQKAKLLQPRRHDEDLIRGGGSRRCIPHSDITECLRPDAPKNALTGRYVCPWRAVIADSLSPVDALARRDPVVIRSAAEGIQW